MRKTFAAVLLLFIVSNQLMSHSTQDGNDKYLFLKGDGNSWRVHINDNGSISFYESFNNDKWEKIPFRSDEKAGPAWDGVSMSLINKKKLIFKGIKNNIIYKIQYLCENNHLVVKCHLSNNSSCTFEPLHSRFILGIDSEMKTYPEWNNKFFPTLLRCEKSHFWGYFMSPRQRILGVCTSEPVASYSINYIHEGELGWSWGHQIKTASLDLLHRLPLPQRHPQDLTSLAPGESKQWTIHLGEINNLYNVKPTLSAWANIPLIECSRYTVYENESVNFKLHGNKNGKYNIKLIAPNGTVKSIFSRTIRFYQGKGLYTLRVTSLDKKICEATIYVREDWSWYIKNARDFVLKYPPILSGSCESYYGYYTAFIGAKYFPDKAKDEALRKRFERNLAVMWDTISWFPKSEPITRVQNHSSLIGMSVDLWEATKNIKYLEWAAHIADYISSDKIQTPDGVYRSKGVYYTAVIYPAKSILELAVKEKKMINDTVWKNRYERHLNSVTRAINDLLIHRDNISTEGDLTFEDGMISCCALQLALFALQQNDKELKKTYANAAKYVLEKHKCLEQLKIPDARMRGATLRYWEALDIYFVPNQIMNSPHGWTGWKIYAEYYLYLLTGDEFYLQDFMDTLGASAQIMNNQGKLRWGFVPDPYINSLVMVENPCRPKTELKVDSIVGEQYLDLISPWYRPENEDKIHPFGEKGGAGDNTVQEIFKVMEECAFTQAYVVVRKDGAIRTWNCHAKKNGNVIEIVPYEKYIDKIHVNTKIPIVAKTILNGIKLTKNITGMDWLGRKPDLVTP